MTAATQNRRPRGTPVGGQFAEAAKAAPEAGVALTEPAASSQRAPLPVPMSILWPYLHREFVANGQPTELAGTVMAFDVAVRIPEAQTLEYELAAAPARGGSAFRVAAIRDAAGEDLLEREEYAQQRDTITRDVVAHFAYRMGWLDWADHPATDRTGTFDVRGAIEGYAARLDPAQVFSAVCACGYSGPTPDCPVCGPCQGCYYITDELQPCDGTCDGLTEHNEQRMRAEYAARSAQTPHAKGARHP